RGTRLGTSSSSPPTRGCGTSCGRRPTAWVWREQPVGSRRPRTCRPTPSGPVPSGPPAEETSVSLWSVHGDGYTIEPGQVVGPRQRLAWLPTVGIGMQHVVAMFGATFLVPLITGFPPSTTLLFSGIGTLLFLLITRNRVPSYLGSSFAFLAPIAAAQADHGAAGALGGVVMAGVALALFGLVVQ